MLRLRDVALFGGRCVLGGLLAMHGSQKLFGAFEGKGLEGTGRAFEAQGLTPGRESAALAGAAELGGGVLTIVGAADPVAQVAIASSMAVAVFSRRENGPLGPGGFELPLTNMALATVLAAIGPGRLRLAPRLPRLVTLAAVAAGSAIAAREIRQLRERSRARRELDVYARGSDPRRPLRIGPVRTAFSERASV